MFQSVRNQNPFLTSPPASFPLLFPNGSSHGWLAGWLVHFYRKPYSAVTVTIENLTSDDYAEDDLSGIPELVEVIKLQATGPGEAARAIRKKLKYGTARRQIRALVLLDGLIQNAGAQFQRGFADEPLLERLRVCGTSSLSDPAVRNKCTELFREWAQYADTPGLERVARLHRELPKRKVAMTQERSKVIRETENPFGDDEEEAEEQERLRKQQQQPSASSSSPPPPAVSSAKFSSPPQEKKKKSKFKSSRSGGAIATTTIGKRFNLEQEKDKMKSVIAESSIASTGLMNALQSINRERERVSDNRPAVQHFEACKKLRRRILRYIHHVENEQWLGSLLHANDELVRALMAYEQLDNSIEADSDSDDELAEQAHMYRMITQKAQEDRATVSAMSGLSLSKNPPRPPRPARRPPSVSSDDGDEEEDDEDEDNPFGDKNVISTPAQEKPEPAW
ncbi:VHS domain protein [Moelleriella libera RCEF 2490]|uniref:VHS domain protein n=1 Tax=Moelleriella libera RCEF 2490 TaxID=1081109 RepID=A0A168CN08_9HYPO|nr:VHS domain protein [Moelleriella libera RCEF 2490]